MKEFNSRNIKKNEYELAERDLKLIFGDSVDLGLVSRPKELDDTVCIFYRGEQIVHITPESIRHIGLEELVKMNIPNLSIAIYEYITHQRKGGKKNESRNK